MKLLPLLFSFLVLSSCISKDKAQLRSPSSGTGSAQAENINNQFKCSNDGHHEKDRAECLLEETILNASNDKINVQIEEFEKLDLTPSTELSSAFIGGSCDSDHICTYNYIVSTDYYNQTSFKSVVAIVSSPAHGIPQIIKVFSQKELQ